ncbi:hypothetical protein SEA_PHINKY_53 [Microbacterium phage Phinky]|nr:hypothetical protein SEA_PHINKY_53 [Microbacterium phage Phinky]
MGARASRRRHEGRAIRKVRRIWKGGVITGQFARAAAGFTRVGKSAERAASEIGALVEVLDTPSGSIAVAQRPDGSIVLGIDPGTGSPSQAGVEAGRSAHSASERVGAAAAEMGLRLLPWQRDVAIAALEGRPTALLGCKQCGRSTVLEVIKRARGPESGLAYVDEIHDFPR